MASESVVVIKDITVMFVSGDRTKPICEQAPATFRKLEAKLEALNGRHFYGVVLDGEYRACVAVAPDEGPGKSPHPTWVIPGGRFVRRKLADWEHHRDLIGPTMMEMRKRGDFDPSRQCIEYYRSQRELLLMAPIR